MKSTCRRRVRFYSTPSHVMVLILSGFTIAHAATVHETAFLEAVGGIDLTNTTEKRLPAVFIVPQGKAVQKGTLLAELDTTLLRKSEVDSQARVEKTKAGLDVVRSSLLRSIDEGKAQIKVAELRLAVAQGAKKTYIEGEHPLEVKTLEQEISIAKLMYARVTEQQKEVLQQYQQQLAGRHDLEEVQLKLSELQAQLKTLQARLHFVQTLFGEQRKTELELAIAERKLELIRVSNQFQYAQEKGEAKVKQEENRLQTETDQLTRLEEQIKACKIYATKEGMILYPKQPVKRGSLVREKQVVLRVVDAKKFDMNVRMALPLAQQVGTGQTVAVRVDAFPERGFTGRITRMRVLSNPSDKTGEAMVTVRVNDPSGKLRVGMSGVVGLELQKKTTPEPKKE